MSSALTATPRDPQQLLDLYLIAGVWLRNRGVAIKYAELAIGRLAQWDHTTRTLRLKPNSPIRQQVWVLTEFIAAMKFGTAGTSARREGARLYLVPAQRAETSPPLT